MAFKLHIKNIGKLTDANIEIGKFTVFAGPNNTGKSFVSKLLYSLFDAMNANHADVYIQTFAEPIRDIMKNVKELHTSEIGEILFPFLIEFQKLGNVFNDFTIEDVEDVEGLDKSISELAVNVKNIRESFSDIRVQLESVKKQEMLNVSPGIIDIDEILNNMEKVLADFHKTLSELDAMLCIIAGIRYKVIDNLTRNFQVPSLTELQGREDVPSQVNIEDFGKFEVENAEIKFNMDPIALWKLKEYSDVIYLESPVYWKLKNALELLRINSRRRYAQRERLSGVPEYFYDLAGALKYGYVGDVDFPFLFERLTGKDVLGGKIVISESGDLLFQEDGRNFSLPVTAMGVANLGVLALLIERKILNKNTFLFIDEPEAHLHPAWQVVIAETLFELAKGGVNVVIATHSAEILKWLEVHVKNNPDDEGIIALNKFPANGDETEGQDFTDKMAAIKQELTKPFADLYIEGLL